MAKITDNVTKLKGLIPKINKEIEFTVELKDGKGIDNDKVENIGKKISDLAQSIEVAEIGINRGLSVETMLGNVQLPPLAPTGTDTNCSVTFHLLDTLNSVLDSDIMNWLRDVNDLIFHEGGGTVVSYPYARLVLYTPGGPTFNFIGARPKTITTTEMNHAGRTTLLRTLVMAADGAFIGKLENSNSTGQSQTPAGQSQIPSEQFQTPSVTPPMTLAT